MGEQQNWSAKYDLKRNGSDGALQFEIEPVGRHENLNHFRTKPLYLQLRDALVERIAVGHWKAGDMVPNEFDLAREFGVSSGTMRKTLELLEKMHLVTRLQGRGTFVNDQASQDIVARYCKLRGPDGAQIDGYAVAGQVTQGLATGLERDRLRLGKGQGARVYRFRRQRVREGETFLVEDVAVPATLFPGLAEAPNPPPITVLALRHGVLLGQAQERVSLSIPERDVS
jgi:GntR family transcriptional regulator